MTVLLALLLGLVVGAVLDRVLARGDQTRREVAEQSQSVRQLVEPLREQLGRVVRLHADQLGYANGADVFVIAVEVNRATGISQVTVLVPLEALA